MDGGGGGGDGGNICVLSEQVGNTLRFLRNLVCFRQNPYMRDIAIEGKSMWSILIKLSTKHNRTENLNIDK